MANSNRRNGVTNMNEVDAFIRQLSAIGQQLDVTAADRAVQKGAEFFAEKVKNDPNTPISSNPGPHAKHNVTFIKTGEGTYKVGFSSTDYFYMWFLEKGTKAGTYKDRNGVTRSYKAKTARPFFYPLFEQLKVDIKNTIMQQVRRELGL